MAKNPICAHGRSFREEAIYVLGSLAVYAARDMDFTSLRVFGIYLAAYSSGTLCHRGSAPVLSMFGTLRVRKLHAIGQGSKNLVHLGD